MRHYAKFLFIAVLCGITSVIGYIQIPQTRLLSEIILSFCFNGVDYYPQYIIVALTAYTPFILFQIFYGTYIYRHFCSASVYFFSRNCNRSIWFIKECFVLYIFSLAFAFLFLLSGVAVTSMVSHVIFDKVSIYIFVYYLLIYSLFLFFTTLAINIISIILTSNVGFIIVEGITLLGMSLFLFMGELFIKQKGDIVKNTWLFKINPFAHLVFKIHSSFIGKVDKVINKNFISFDLNITLITFLVIAIVFSYFGMVIVNNYNFIESNKETGGV